MKTPGIVLSELKISVFFVFFPFFVVVVLLFFLLLLIYISFILFCFLTVFSSEGFLELITCLPQLSSFWASRAEHSNAIAKASSSSLSWYLLSLHDS